MTLTLISSPVLDRKYVDGLITFFRLLRMTELWKGLITGGIYSIDTTWGEKGWHVHLHVLLETRGWLPAAWLADLKEQWREITGGSHVIHIRTVNKAAVKELIKYQAKAATFAFLPSLVDAYLTAFHNVRRIQAFGSFLGVDVSEIEIESKPWRCDCGGCTSHRDWRQAAIVSVDVVELDGKGGYRMKPLSDPESPLLSRITWADAVFPLSVVN